MKYIYLLIFIYIVGCTESPSKKYDFVISNVHLIDGTGNALKSNVNVYIKDGRIALMDKTEVSKKETIIDGTDKYLMPGLFDCHAHTGTFQIDFPKFIHFGVTSIFVPGGSTCTNEYYKEMREIGKQDSIPAPRVFHTSQHFIMEGSHPVRTYASSNWEDGKTVFYLNDTLQIESLVKEVSQYDIQGIKLTIEDGPMPPPIPRMPQEFINKVVKEAEKNNTKVFVHISDNIELRMALEAGINNFIHFTGVNLDFQNDREMIEDIYQSDVSWVTTLMIDKSFIYPLHPEWVSQTEIINIYSAEERFSNLTSESEIEKAKKYLSFFETDYGLKDPTLESIMSFQVEDIKTLFENGVNMVLGTDAGNTYNFHGHSLHEEMQLLELGGMKPMDIIKMGTYNAAKMMDTLDELGTIEQGKIADMVLLDKNPLESIKNTLSINTVFKNGIIQQRIE
ncbi:Imidazolonepropionase [Arenibacter palladensis]|uniref:Imidazolonepropionase n=1 Tax=Arenibacter palladensis TaxID=237373 RepID=A0A1M5A6Q9_9FLAO|nr:amidohydrolase family protein [Arenibacter palladensis]SHF25950.1 Imidazolonepropionase [Arenibacter palladensis]